MYAPDALILVLRRFLGLPVVVRPEKIDDTSWIKLVMVRSTLVHVCLSFFELMCLACA